MTLLARLTYLLGLVRARVVLERDRRRRLFRVAGVAVLEIGKVQP